MKERVAVIGTGISGLTTAYLLHKDYDVTVFEADARIGGHTSTVDVLHEGQNYAIDTGFIVFNDWTYPNFIQLMDQLGVQSKPTEMSFSVSCSETGLEYSGSNLSTLFVQKRNLLNPLYWLMLRDIVRFNKSSLVDIEDPDLAADISLGEYLQLKSYGNRFRQHYLLPMASAIWSSSLADVERMPLRFFVQFFKNHGLLSLNDRPQWRVIKGGSREYIKPLIAGFSDRIRLNCPVSSVRRGRSNVYIDSPAEKDEEFDQVVFACHSDQALSMLADISQEESEVLGAIPYTDNEVVLHRDTSLLPKRRGAWASWNYLLGRNQDKAVLTYNMNILQGLESDTTFCVTLNDTSSIDPEKIVKQFTYAHPEFSLDGVQAQKRWSEINGVNRTWFCGAWMGNGFHEDGVASARRVADAMQLNEQSVAA